MWVRIGFGDVAVCGPTSVADPEGAAEIIAQSGLKFDDSANTFGLFDAVICPDGDARRIVAPVFQTLQSI
jgi:hypothetical protein